MKRSMGRMLVGLVLLLMAPGLMAQQSPTWYTVEVIVFERTVGAQAPGEVWPPLDSVPAVDAATPLLPPFRGSLAQVPFRLLPEGELRLAEAARGLGASPAYNVLRHLAWRQPGLDAEEAVAVRLAPRGGEALLADRLLRHEAGLATGEADVEGVLRLVLSRFLHIEADLLYYRPQPRPQAAVFEQDEEELTPSLAAFRMIESRRMRSGEIHYLDHPLFGVIVSVQRYTPPRS
ncbi:peptidoglycan binding protein CsiV [Ectothiorhodospiraceae bacterium 2226]|nr:peptidoglycan binding protein CsiV [Ectothiorhodospiraceae bacterium 2226]